MTTWGFSGNLYDRSDARDVGSANHPRQLETQADFDTFSSGIIYDDPSGEFLNVTDTRERTVFINVKKLMERAKSPVERDRITDVLAPAEQERLDAIRVDKLSYLNSSPGYSPLSRNHTNLVFFLGGVGTIVASSIAVSKTGNKK